MNRIKVKKILNDVAESTDALSAIKLLVNLVEDLVEKIDDLEDKLQKTTDENNRLKGEQGRPNIRKQSKDDGAGNKDHSSEENRKNRGEKSSSKSKSKKKETVKIDKHITLEMNKDELPNDAIFKGYETRTFQDIKIATDNVEFRREVYYSPSLNKTIIASLPKGYHGEFGPGVRSLIIFLYRDSCMTQPAIARFLGTFGIQISMNTISRMITEEHGLFHLEKESVLDAALKVSPYHHIDDTSCRVNGKNFHTHILCGPLFTAYFTRPHKNRLTILEILCRNQLNFSFNHVSYEMMSELGLSKDRLADLKSIVGNCDITLTRDEADKLLMRIFPNPKKHSTSRRFILEASAITYYRNTDHFIEHIMCDGAPQFNKIALHHSLCWVHEGRHFKKLIPLYTAHQDALDSFIVKFWEFYHALLDYKINPLPNVAIELKTKFDETFSTETCYIALNDRIAKTLLKKEALLLALDYPFLPLHNNSAELGARVQARMRDINLHTISENGTKTKDTFATIVQTAKKLGVNVYNYIYDRVAEKFEMPALSDLIKEKSTEIFNTT